MARFAKNLSFSLFMERLKNEEITQEEKQFLLENISSWNVAPDEVIDKIKGSLGTLSCTGAPVQLTEEDILKYGLPWFFLEPHFRFTHSSGNQFTLHLVGLRIVTSSFSIENLARDKTSDTGIKNLREAIQKIAPSNRNCYKVGAALPENLTGQVLETLQKINRSPDQYYDTPFQDIMALRKALNVEDCLIQPSGGHLNVVPPYGEYSVIKVSVNKNGNIQAEMNWA